MCYIVFKYYSISKQASEVQVKIWWLLNENSTTYTVFSISEKLDFWTYFLLKPDDAIRFWQFRRNTNS
jgi:hypothetical protein